MMRYKASAFLHYKQCSAAYVRILLSRAIRTMQLPWKPGVCVSITVDTRKSDWGRKGSRETDR